MKNYFFYSFIQLQSSSLHSHFQGSTGKKLKNGTWLGSVGDILSGRADISAFNGHVLARHEYVDWSAPLTYECLVFITHKPKSFFSASAIVRPFPLGVWMGFIIAITVVCCTLKAISKFTQRTGTEFPATIQGMIMYVLSSFLEQDAHTYLEVLHLHSVRVLAVFWLLFSLVIATAYKGKLVSLIAFPGTSWVPKTFDELAYSDYQVGLNVIGKGGATYSVLSTSKSPVYQTFFKKMEIYPDPVNCLKAAFQSDLGCLMVKSVAEFFGAKNFTDKFGRNPFQPSEQTALFREDGYIWEKRAVFRKHFDRATWSMLEAGLSSLWFQRDLNYVKKKRLDWEKLNPGENSSIKIPKEDDGPSKLQVMHLLGLFYLYVCGHLAGVFLLIWEKVKFLCVKKQEIRQRELENISSSNQFIRIIR